MTTDRLSWARVFEDAGIERSKAEAVASAVFDAIYDNVATKADISAVRGDLSELRVALRAGIEEVRTELRGEIAAVCADLAALEQRLERRIDLMVTSLGALVVVLAGLLFAALHLWPPGHG